MSGARFFISSSMRLCGVESPDNIDTNAAPQNRGNWNSEPKLIMRTHPVPLPSEQLPPGGGYANPQGPTDT